MNLGKKLINLRKQEKMTQEKFADFLGVTRQTISNWELNVTKPDLTQIEKISKLFHVSIDELLDNDVQNIIVEKIYKTEKIVNKNTKTIRVLVITIYFILLLSSIATIIYYATKRDFTKPYQTEYICKNKNKHIKITLEFEPVYTNDNKEEIIEHEGYIVVWDYEPDSEQNINGYTPGDKYETGKSFADIFNSLHMIKDFFITEYNLTCR